MHFKYFARSASLSLPYLSSSISNVEDGEAETRTSQIVQRFENIFPHTVFLQKKVSESRTDKDRECGGEVHKGTEGGFKKGIVSEMRYGPFFNKWQLV